MIKTGDLVEVIDDTLTGVVKEQKGNRLVLETPDGFLVECRTDQVVKVKNMPLDDSRIREAVKIKEGHPELPKISQKRMVQKPVEIDLHIEELTESTRNMTDFEMLNLQIQTAKSRLEYAIANRIQHLVFIHGVGAGVLRMELETLFRRYEQVEYFDADFQRYGRGATEVYIFQNY